MPQKPSRSDAAGMTAYRSLKYSLWTLAIAMDNAVNERLHSFDKTTPTRKSAELRQQWKQLKTSHHAEVSSLTAQFLCMMTNEQIIDV
ncbi:hypothetical protein PI125_g18741 [Phytophthora idaei]|nr:hypothetical protein PI125_g18741 [Phytophthora idaei]